MKSDIATEMPTTKNVKRGVQESTTAGVGHSNGTDEPLSPSLLRKIHAY